MYKSAKTEVFQLIATKIYIYININDKMTVSDLNDVIGNSDVFKNKVAFVIQIKYVLSENRKHEEQRLIDIE